MSDALPSATAPAPSPPAAGGVLALYLRQLAEHGWQSDPAQLAVIGHLEELRQRLLAARRAPALRLARWLTGSAPATPVRGLYLWGPVGRGKTWLMDLFCASLPPTLARRTHFHRFMHEVHAELRRLGRRSAPLLEVARALARGTRVLCFDELNVADIGDAMILAGLFEALFARGVSLVATSNVPPAELYRDGLQRQRFLPAIRLLEERLDVVRIGGDTDYRLRQLTAAGVYLTCDAPDTAARLVALFAALADRQPQVPGFIQIEGRPIAVRAAGCGVAWFEFDALCSGPRSQDDYIEIAREYHAVIVAGVPRLDAAHDDEARRFIALVDEFYDRAVKLIVAAAAPAAELYRGERLAALFARTASRLIEMQSAEYLAREHRP